jgi:hypothetical protein
MNAYNGLTGTNTFKGWQYGFGGDVALGFGYGGKYFGNQTTIPATPGSYGGGGMGAMGSAGGNGAGGAVLIFQFW